MKLDDDIKRFLQRKQDTIVIADCKHHHLMKFLMSELYTGISATTREVHRAFSVDNYASISSFPSDMFDKGMFQAKNMGWIQPSPVPVAV